MTDPELRPARTWDEVEETAEGAGRAFADESAAFFRRRTLAAPSLPLENTLLALVDGELVSSLQLYERRVFLGGVPAPVGAVGNVMTLPEHQGEGYASALLDYAGEFAASKGYPLTVLVGDPGFYSRLGYEALPDESRVFADPAPLSDGGNGEWRAFDAARDLDAVASIHREEARRVDGAFDRNPALWRQWVLAELVDPADLAVYREDGDIAGYLAQTRAGEGVVCLEVGYGGADRAGFLADCWNRVVAETDGQVRWDPPLAGLEDALRDAGHRPRAETMLDRTGERPMVRAVDGALSARSGGALTSTADAVERFGPDWRLSALDKF